MKYSESRVWFSALGLLLLILSGCNPSRNAITAPTVVITPDEPGPLTITRPPAKEYPYRPSETRSFDLLHTRLEVAFDWEKEQLNGKARLRVSPWFAAKNQLELDAKGFVIHQVARFDGGSLKDLTYTYDNEKLILQLDRMYTRQETLEVYIAYTARPQMLDSLLSPEAAQDKGLYFINPDGKIPNKPRQVWTQGEAHGSPAWFPTMDQTNARCTQEIYMTVADSFQTLSNGILVNSTRNGNGTRTDYWRMSLPHAPYLFAMVVGEFSIVKEEWRGREVSYYVEKEYAQYADMIFGNTPEMLEFFSNKLGLEYPWEKYSQAVVRDFVSGAMENTTATIHFGALQHDAREHLDNTFEDYISHELFHQWFGDLLTCESWANLTLNEGFATYGEFLWKEYKYGDDVAKEHLLGDRRSYFYEAQRKQVPLIRYHHQNADAMFDGHSYQKGGQVIHMLRKLLGDDAFFASIKTYLSKNAFTAVEIHHLRLAFEEVMGQDLNWFFDQWFLAGGHPKLRVERAYASGEYRLRLEQTQDMERYPLYRLPIELEIGMNGKQRKVTVWMTSADTTFVLPVAAEPAYVAVDAGKDLLLTIVEDDNAMAAWTAQLEAGRGFGQMNEALGRLQNERLDDAALAAVRRALQAPYAGVRVKALSVLENYAGAKLPAITGEVVERFSDSEARVRARAVRFVDARKEILMDSLSADQLKSITSALLLTSRDSSYAVQINSLKALLAFAPKQALEVAKTLTQNTPPRLVRVIAQILQTQDDPGTLDFVEAQFREQVQMNGKLGAIMDLDDYLVRQDDPVKSRGLDFLMRAAENDSSRYIRLTAARALVSQFRDVPAVRAFMERQLEVEKVPMVLNLYKMALED